MRVILAYAFTALCVAACIVSIVGAGTIAAIGGLASTGQPSAISFFTRLASHGAGFTLAFCLLPYVTALTSAIGVCDHADRLQRARGADYATHAARVLNGMHNVFTARCAAIQAGEFDHVSPEQCADILNVRYPYIYADGEPTGEQQKPFLARALNLKRTGPNTYAL